MTARGVRPVLSMGFGAEEIPVEYRFIFSDASCTVPPRLCNSYIVYENLIFYLIVNVFEIQYLLDDFKQMLLLSKFIFPID